MIIGASDSTVGSRALVLHMSDMSSMAYIPYSPLSLLEVIPECKGESKTWASLDLESVMLSEVRGQHRMTSSIGRV